MWLKQQQPTYTLRRMNDKNPLWINKILYFGIQVISFHKKKERKERNKVLKYASIMGSYYKCQ